MLILFICMLLGPIILFMPILPMLLMELMGVIPFIPFIPFIPPIDIGFIEFMPFILFIEFMEFIECIGLIVPMLLKLLIPTGPIPAIGPLWAYPALYVWWGIPCWLCIYGPQIIHV